jgi:hypothetical protein
VNLIFIVETKDKYAYKYFIFVVLYILYIFIYFILEDNCLC